MSAIRKVMLVGVALHQGGVERVAAALANYLVEIGVEVDYVTYDSAPSFYPMDNRVQRIPINLIRDGGGIRGFLNNAERILALRRELIKSGPDAAIGLFPEVSVLLTVAATGTRIPIIVYEPSNPLILPKEKIWRLLRSVSACLADGLMFQTGRARNCFPKSVHPRSRVIPNPIANPHIGECYSGIREKIVASMGRLEKGKGFETLIEAFALIADQVKDYKLVIYGEGTLRLTLERLIDSLGMSSRVELPGAREDAVCFVARASVFVLSSEFEGMPNALIEAMACGVPSVSTDCPMGPAELIKDGENGFLVPVGDVNAMAQAIRQIIVSAPLARQLSNNALKIRSQLNPEKIFSEMLDFFQYVKDHPLSSRLKLIYDR